MNRSSLQSFTVPWVLTDIPEAERERRIQRSPDYVREELAIFACLKEQGAPR